MALWRRVIVNNSVTPNVNLVSSVTVVQNGSVIETFYNVDFQGNFIVLPIRLHNGAPLTLRFRCERSFPLLVDETITIGLSVSASQVHAQGVLFDKLDQWIDSKLTKVDLSAQVNDLSAVLTNIKSELEKVKHITEYFTVTITPTSSASNFVVGTGSADEVATHTVVAGDLVDGNGKLVVGVPSDIASKHTFAVKKGDNREQNIDVIASTESYFFYEFLAAVGDVITVIQTGERESLDILDRIEHLEEVTDAHAKLLAKEGFIPVINSTSD